MCLIGTHILVCQYMLDVTSGYGRLSDLIVFFGSFHTLLRTIHVWRVVSSPNLLRLYVQSIHTFYYVHMSDVKASYEKFSDLNAVFGNLHLLLHV